MDTLVSFPRQKLKYSQKDDAWRKQCVDAVVSLHATESVRRATYVTKKRNYDLYNGKINERDFQYVTNPLRLENTSFQLPATLQPYDIISPIFNFLIGEEGKRPFNPVVRAVNEDAISQKEQQQKEQIMAGLQQLLVNSLSQDPKQPNDIDKDLENLSQYSVQDMRERIANHLLVYFRKHPEFNLNKIFEDGWKDALIGSEEIYRITEVGGHPKVKRCNPLEIYFELPHNEDYIDEAEKILEKTRMSYSTIIDNYYEYLSDDDIEEIEALQEGSIYSPSTPIRVQDIESINDLTRGDYSPGLYVYICTWKSKRKVGIYNYIDENGQLQEEVVDETFKLKNPSPGESIEWFWINEYWEGTRIGPDIYVNIHPKKTQFRSTYNISRCKSGYIGTVYSATNTRAVSLMDRLVPWIYIYLVTWFRTENLMAANQGKIANINISQIPDGWEIEKWLYYATSMKIMFNNPFNEGKKGAATGKLAGNMNNSGNTALDMELGSSIQHNISILQYIESKLQATSGISQQRMGDIAPQELVGNTERSIIQSSYQTELYFKVHNAAKIRVLSALVQMAKELYEDKTQHLQYITDDLASVFFTVEGTEFADCDYGVFMTDSLKDQDAINALKQHLQAALQNDKIEFSNIIDVFNSESLADLKHKLILAETKRNEQMAQQQQAQIDAMKEQTEQAREAIDKQMELKQYEIDENNRTKIEVATLQTYFQKTDQDLDNDGTPDVLEVQKLALDERKHQSEEILKRLELQTKERESLRKERLERDKLSAAEKIEKLKGENAIKVAKARPKPSAKK